MPGRSLILCAALLMMPGCAGHHSRSSVAVQGQAATASVANWHNLVTDDDRTRLRDWRQSFTRALAAARASGNGLSIDREGTLLDPDAAIEGGGPPPGNYMCRVVKLGAQRGNIANYNVFPNYRCEIAAEGTVLSFAKRDGVQRPVGLIFEDSAARQIFLGTLMLGDETLALQYGRDQTRDMVASVERIADARWRMVLPYPHFDSMLDVIELIPDNK